jgi:DMSO reductase family type II enzyme chaperone
MEMEPLAPAQSILYRYLAEGFSNPDEHRLAYLADMAGVVQAACEEMAEAGEAPGPGPSAEELETALAEARAGRIGDLQAEYTQLFVAGMPATVARLVEAVQREGMLVGEATEDVAAMYLRFGLEVKGREPDHLTAELEFLAYLAGTPVEAGSKEAERYRRARGKFLREHLLQWVPGIVKAVRANTEQRLILALAGLLEWTVTAEEHLLQPQA